MIEDGIRCVYFLIVPVMEHALVSASLMFKCFAVYNTIPYLHAILDNISA